jgi:oligopeptide/dipeptide ABC transporter ATP-binding protein
MLGRPDHWIRAVDGVSLRLEARRTLGVVGESGSGKSTLGRAVVRLIHPTEGSVRFQGVDLASTSGRALRRARRSFQMIFQDPHASLDPYQSVRTILTEPLRIHHLAVSRSDADERAVRLLELVGLSAAFLGRRSYQLSGGQSQRVAIARALVLEPNLIVCDEAVSALDVSVQAQIVNLLADIQSQLGVSYLFISHDLAVVRQLADDVVVMYRGRIVEMGSAESVSSAAAHPYTIALLSAVPIADPEIELQRRRIVLTGDVPSAAIEPKGCRFASRCWLRTHLGNPDVCESDEPELRDTKESSHLVACHFAERVPEMLPKASAVTHPAGAPQEADRVEASA